MNILLLSIATILMLMAFASRSVASLTDSITFAPGHVHINLLPHTFITFIVAKTNINIDV